MKNKVIVTRPKTQKINPKEVAKKKLVDRLDTDPMMKDVSMLTPKHGLDIDEEFLSLPRDITEVHSKELGSLLYNFTQQKVYMRTLYTWQTMYSEDSKLEYDKAFGEIYVRINTENPKLSEKGKEILVNSQKSIATLLEEYREHYQKLLAIEQSINSLEEIIFSLSREVSRRSKDFDENSRVDNVGSKKYNRG